MKILFIGDIMGNPGRKVVKNLLPEILKETEIDFVIANGENIAGGKGVTAEVAEEMFDHGVDVLTGGNHIWQNRAGVRFLEEDERVLRPANYPDEEEIPGRGAGIFRAASGMKIGVVNLQGRVFMPPLDCPFRKVRKEVDRLRRETTIILVDFHAEATSEKIAMGWFLDGAVTAVVGTHTHVQTADEKILPGGTAFITDVGMSGPHDGVIGVRTDIVLESMLKRLPVRHKLASGDLQLNSVIIEFNPDTGKASSIERRSRRID